MKAFFVTQVSIGKYRLTYGANAIEGSAEKIGKEMASALIEACQDVGKDEAYRFEFVDVLPSVSLANAVYELEGVTRAKAAFYQACQDFKTRPGADTLKMRYEAYERFMSLLQALNLDNLWHAIGVTSPDKAA